MTLHHAGLNEEGLMELINDKFYQFLRLVFQGFGIMTEYFYQFI